MFFFCFLKALYGFDFTFSALEPALDLIGGASARDKEFAFCFLCVFASWRETVVFYF